MLQRRLQDFICTHSRNVHLATEGRGQPGRPHAPKKTLLLHATLQSHVSRSLQHLLSSANQDRCKEAEGRPQLVDARVVIGDAPESRGAELQTHPCVCVNPEGSSYLYQGYTKFSRINSNTCRRTRESGPENHSFLFCSDSSKSGVTG